MYKELVVNHLGMDWSMLKKITRKWNWESNIRRTIVESYQWCRFIHHVKFSFLYIFGTHIIL